MSCRKSSACQRSKSPSVMGQRFEAEVQVGRFARRITQKFAHQAILIIQRADKIFRNNSFLNGCSGKKMASANMKAPRLDKSQLVVHKIFVEIVMPKFRVFRLELRT